MPHLEVFVEKIKQEGFDRGYYGNQGSWIKKVTNDINTIPKLMGGDLRVFDENEFVWLVVNTFLNNGGYQRDFSDTSDPLDLTPITVYDVDAYYKQTMAEYGSMWGVAFGASNESEAGEMFMENPHNWESDREMNDYDDYGDTEVYELNRVESKKLEFSKGSVGLS